MVSSLPFKADLSWRSTPRSQKCAAVGAIDQTKGLPGNLGIQVGELAAMALVIGVISAFVAYALAWRLTGDEGMWRMVRRIGKGIGLGDLTLFAAAAITGVSLGSPRGERLKILIAGLPRSTTSSTAMTKPDSRPTRAEQTARRPSSEASKPRTSANAPGWGSATVSPASSWWW